jgi:hypothetical protein
VNEQFFYDLLQQDIGNFRWFLAAGNNYSQKEEGRVKELNQIVVSFLLKWHKVWCPSF